MIRNSQPIQNWSVRAKPRACVEPAHCSHSILIHAFPSPTGRGRPAALLLKQHHMFSVSYKSFQDHARTLISSDEHRHSSQQLLALYSGKILERGPWTRMCNQPRRLPSANMHQSCPRCEGQRCKNNWFKPTSSEKPLSKGTFNYTIITRCYLYSSYRLKKRPYHKEYTKDVN